MIKRIAARLIVGAVLTLGTGCDSTSTQPDVTEVSLPVDVNPSNFAVRAVPPNPLFPLVPGTVHRFVGQTQQGEEVSLIEVTDQTKEIMGVTATVVQVRVWLDETRMEDTFKWYAQDKDGNVWYFGEGSNTFVNGRVASTVGSWEAGVNGAKAGIIMWASPKVGSIYYQEYYKDKAEDIGEVLSLNETVTVPAGRFEGCLKTETTTPLAPNMLKHNYYCPGIGHTLTIDSRAGGTRFELTALESN